MPSPKKYNPPGAAAVGGNISPMDKNVFNNNNLFKAKAEVKPVPNKFELGKAP